MENKELLKQFEEFLLENEKANSSKTSNTKEEYKLTMEQTIWINTILFVIASLVFKYITDNFSFFQDFSLFSYLSLTLSIPLLIWRICDVFIFKQFDLFKGFEENPIAKAIFALGFFIFMGLSILATSGTVIFKPNTAETETRTETIIEYPKSNNSRDFRADSISFNPSTKEY